MKTQKQLIKEIEKINNLFTVQQGALNFNVGEIINIVVEACEEAIPPEKDLLMNEGAILLRERILENLKKLKSK